MTGLIVAACVTAAVFVALAHAAASPRHYGSRPAWIDRFAWAVAVCETGKGHRYPDFQHRTRHYGGAWGWFVGTWALDRYPGMPRFPWNATPHQQYKVFVRGRARGRYWGCIAHGGYRSWL